MNLFNLMAKLTLDTSDYDKKITEVKGKNIEVSNNTKKQIGIGAVAGWTALAAAIVAVIKQIVQLGVQTAQYADQIGDVAQKWGFSTQEIQEFDYWATMNGTTLESLLTGMRGLVNQAEAGSEAFAKLGISVRNSDGTLKDQKTLFLETITALQGIENQTERNALQFEIFGRAGIELGQIIDKSKEELEGLSQEAEDLGLIISEDAINWAGTFNDKIDQIKLGFKSALAELLAGTPEAEERFIEFINNLQEMLISYIPKFAGFIVEFVVNGVTQTIRLLPSLIQNVINALINIDWIQVLWNLIMAIGEALLNLFKIIINNLVSKLTFGLVGPVFDVSTPSSLPDTSGVEQSISDISNATTSNNSYSDNSNYTININNSTPYSEQDAKKLAQTVAKEISTQKQSSGR